jgi:hypothetical protein
LADNALDLASIDAVIAAFAKDGAQSVSVAGRSFTRVQLLDLIKARRQLRMEAHLSQGGMPFYLKKIRPGGTR